jgi:uncharacterized membrane protein YdfJ with MMPL/SSD domain
MTGSIGSFVVRRAADDQPLPGGTRARAGAGAGGRAQHADGRARSYFSGVTVAAALAVLLIFPMYFLRSFACAGIGVVVISVAAAVVPAVTVQVDRQLRDRR